MRALLVAGLALFLATSMTLARDGTEILAKVADEAITLDDFLRYARSSAAFQRQLGMPGGARRILDNMIMERLLILEGERLAIARPKGELAEDDFAYAIAVRNQLTESCAPPDEADSRTFYEANPALFSTPLYVRLRRIGLKPEPGSSDDTLQRMMELKARLAQDKVSFEQAVADLSEDEFSKDRQGDIGFIPLEDDQHPEFTEMRTASIGDLIGPVEEPGMVYLYQVTDRREPILGSYEELANQVREAYLQDCQHRALTKLMHRLESRWSVTILIEDPASRLRMP